MQRSGLLVVSWFTWKYVTFICRESMEVLSIRLIDSASGTMDHLCVTHRKRHIVRECLLLKHGALVSPASTFWEVSGFGIKRPTASCFSCWIATWQ